MCVMAVMARCHKATTFACTMPNAAGFLICLKMKIVSFRQGKAKRDFGKSCMQSPLDFIAFCAAMKLTVV